MVFRVVSQKVIHVGEERVQTKPEFRVQGESGDAMWLAAIVSDCGEMETVLQPKYEICSGPNSGKYMIKL
jgi:hypothetical protein